jgi:hypothetical protein
MFDRGDVEFSAEGGVQLRGWLFVPEGAGPHPAITPVLAKPCFSEHCLCGAQSRLNLKAHTARSMPPT